MRKGRIAMASLVVTSALTAGAWTLSAAAVPQPTEQIVVPAAGRAGMVPPDATTAPDGTTARMLAMELRLQAMVRKRDAAAAAAVARAAAAASSATEPASSADAAPPTSPASAGHAARSTYAAPPAPASLPTYAGAPSSTGAVTTTAQRATPGTAVAAGDAPAAHTTTGASGAMPSGSVTKPEKTSEAESAKPTKDGQDD